MRSLFLAATLAGCGGSADSPRSPPHPVDAGQLQARTSPIAEDVNAFQGMLRLSRATVRAQVVAVATETLQSDGTRHVETYGVLEVFHQDPTSSISVGDDLRVDLGRFPHPSDKGVAGEETVLFLSGPFDYVDGSGLPQSWYRLAAWPVGDTLEDQDGQSRWFKLSYAGRGDYAGGWARRFLIDERRLGPNMTSIGLCCEGSYETDANGMQRPDDELINDDALTWSALLGLIRDAATAEGS